ncbi:MAG: hypothetical protein U5M51_14725 [Emticicia sp.]|nr:hypothetical protein [Emticicia sp.]
MKKTIILISFAGMSFAVKAQMIVNDPVNGAMTKVLDMLNPKLTQQVQQIKRAKEQLREQVAITTASETTANAEMAEIDYKSNVSQFSNTFATTALKINDIESKNIALYNYDVSLLGQLPSNEPKHMKYYAHLLVQIEKTMKNYQKQGELLGYKKSAGSVSDLGDIFSGSSGGLSAESTNAEEQKFVDAKNKADALSNQYKDKMAELSQVYGKLTEMLESEKGGFLSKLFEGVINVGSLGLWNKAKDAIKDNSKESIDKWFNQESKSQDSWFNGEMKNLGFDELLSSSNGELGMQLGKGKRVKIDPKEGYMDDYGKLALGYNIAEKYEDINLVLSSVAREMEGIIGKSQQFAKINAEIQSGTNKYSGAKKKQSYILDSQDDGSGEF